MTTSPADRLRGWWKRIRATVRPGDADREMTDEMRFHLEMQIEQNVLAGMSPAEAKRVARLAFGGVERFKEEVRGGRGFPWLESVMRDVRLAVRGLGRSPAFAATAVLTLALGIGAAATIFAVVDAVLLRPLPFDAPDRLIHIWETNPEGSDFSASDPNYLDFRDGSNTATLGAYRVDEVSLTGQGEPRRLVAGAVTASLFPLLGVAPAIGRSFGPDEDRHGGETRVAVLGHELWQTVFGADSAVVGRTISLRGEPFTVLGVMPATFRMLGAEIWLPLAPNPALDRDDHWLGMIGRMADGVSAPQVEAELAAVSRRIGETHPKVAGWGVRVGSLAEWMAGPSVQRSSLLLAAAVAVLLLMACANVANLLLARATTRQTDLSIRIAIGAGRGHLVRQLLTESGVLALVGAAVGLLAAWWAVATIPVAAGGLVPGLDGLAMSPRVVAFSLVAAVAATMLAGLVPALRASSVDVHATLKRAGRTGSSHGQGRLRETLVVGQVALAVVLLVGGGLMVRSLVALNGADTGFTAGQALVVPLSLDAARYREEWQVTRFYEQVIVGVERVPGVRAAGATSVDPFSGFNLQSDVTPEERAAEFNTRGFMWARWRVVTPGYFAAAGVPVLRGRLFGDEDLAGSVPVAIVSRTFAERMWPGVDPLGKRFFWGGTEGTPRTVVGVAGDVSDVAVSADNQPVMFLSSGQIPWPAMTLVVRADGHVSGLADQIRRAVWALDPSLPVPVVRPLEESRARALATPRFSALVLGAFAGAALLLSVVGLYGVMAATVAERTRELGIRLALGASPRRVVRDLVRRGMLLVAAGAALGTAAALLLTRLMGSLLYRTPGTDPVVFAAVLSLLLAVGAAAAYLPSTRATRVDPLITIRGE